MFIANPKLYKALYVDKPQWQQEVQWQVPRTKMEVADALKELKSIGLDLKVDLEDTDFESIKDPKDPILN